LISLDGELFYSSAFLTEPFKVLYHWTEPLWFFSFVRQHFMLQHCLDRPLRIRHHWAESFQLIIFAQATFGGSALLLRTSQGSVFLGREPATVQCAVSIIEQKTLHGSLLSCTTFYTSIHSCRTFKDSARGDEPLNSSAKLHFFS
jgi:hypothetical protein